MEKKEKISLVILLAISILTYSLLAHAVKDPPGSYEAQGGNITPINMTTVTQTQVWQGFAGQIYFITPTSPTKKNATGGWVNGSNFNLTVPCTPVSVSGNILYSNSSNPPIGLVPGNLTILDNYVTKLSDSGTHTFKNLTTFVIGGVTINNVPTTYTFVNDTPQNKVFREGYLNDINNNMVFAVQIYEEIYGYNFTKLDYQAILPTRPRNTTTYYITTDLKVVCPPTPYFPGGGGGQPVCMPLWNCTQWGKCEKGIQKRNCSQIYRCYPIIMPPLVRKCKWEQPKPTIEQATLIEKTKTQQFNITLPEKIKTISGKTKILNVRIENPRAESIENFNLELLVPESIRIVNPLHFKTRLYGQFFGIKPRRNAKELAEWKTLTPVMKRLMPKTAENQKIKILTPIVFPQTITGYLKAKATETPIITKTMGIEVVVPEFVITAEKNKKNKNKIEIIMQADNRKQEKREETVEVNFNKGKSTLYTEIYNLQLPSNEIKIFGFQYELTKIPDSITAWYQGKKYKAEIR